MAALIAGILQQHPALFGTAPEAVRLSTGFTNTVYAVNGSLIVKICTDPRNEKNFAREITFYQAHKGSDFLPRLYAAGTDKKIIPYFYEVIEKVDGVTLYHVWHTFGESQREDTINQLCAILQTLHRHTGKAYDWAGMVKEQFTVLYDKAKALSLFSGEEQTLLNRASADWESLLQADDFVLVHNDLHFDNIFSCQGKLKLIDFERSLYAPRDFELDILFRMVRKPWKFAGEETEPFTAPKDYEAIMGYMKKYYPALFQIPHLPQRLAIYDMVYFLRQLTDHPELEELKTDVLAAARAVVWPGSPPFDMVPNPQ